MRPVSLETFLLELSHRTQLCFLTCNIKEVSQDLDLTVIVGRLSGEGFKFDQ